MSGTASPEDEKFLESLRNLLKVGQEFEKLKRTEATTQSDEVKTEESEKPIEVPPEQQIEPAERVEPLKSMVEPEYVKKVIKQMDTMSAEQLKEALKKIKACTGGNKKTLRKRVAQYYRKENALLNRKLEPNSEKTSRYFDYLIAIDFECTCVEIIYDYPHEIIEFPAVLIDVREMKIVSEFRTYVRPVKNPVLSEFCMQFTKIAQETVDNAPYFREALQRLYTWMRKFGLGEKNTRFAFVTDGPHDMWKFMQFQCLLSNIRMPHMFRSFINIKKTFKEKFNGLIKGNGKSGIENMLERLDLSFVGNKHSGLDDARNIAAIAIQMMKLKIELRINQKCSYKESGRASGTIHKDEEDELDDNIDLHSIDISRRDFQLWMRRLPLKLSSVTRREFLCEEYLDCESCDDLTDDKNDPEAFEQKKLIRDFLQQKQTEDFERIANERGWPNVGEFIQQHQTDAGININDDVVSESEEEDYGPEFDMLDLVEPASSTSRTEFELKSVWECDRTDAERDDITQAHSIQNNEGSMSGATSRRVTSLPRQHDTDSSEDMQLMAQAPKNSLASSNRFYY